MKERSYKKLLQQIGSTLEHARKNAIKAVNNELVKANWEIGKYIVEYEQHGKLKASYGSALLTKLAIDLRKEHGKGFSKSSIYQCRQFYIQYPKFQTVSGKLSWSHYIELIGVSNPFARSFYEQQSLRDNWSIRELKRQVDTSLFERISLSKNKKDVARLAQKGQLITSPESAIKDPYVFEFLNLPTAYLLKERALEGKLLDNLQSFLLELGKGFSFVARQYKLSIDNEHFYIDLVFYHRILRCFVLIDLKTKKIKHQDIGQMNLYLNYFKDEESNETENDPIGIIIAADKNEFLVKYAMGGLSNKIFVSKYQLHLPNQKELEHKVKEIIETDTRTKKRNGYKKN